MQEDERDILEVLIFAEIEETVGAWLRTIIQRLEREQTAIGREHRKQPTSYRQTTAMPPYQKHDPKSEKPPRLTVLDRRRQVLPISGPPGFGQLG